MSYTYIYIYACMSVRCHGQTFKKTQQPQIERCIFPYDTMATHPNQTKSLFTHLDQHVRRPKEEEEELQQRQHQQRAREHDGGKDAPFVEVVLAGEAAVGCCLGCVCCLCIGLGVVFFQTKYERIKRGSGVGMNI